MKKFISVTVLTSVLIFGFIPGFVTAAPDVMTQSTAAINQKESPKDSAAPDVFFHMAHICQSFANDCIPDNLVTNSFSVYIKVHVPATQVYTRHYIVTDIQGAIVGYETFTSSLTLGTNHLSFPFSQTSGKLYRFVAIVSGADGRSAVSDTYFFKVL